MKKKADKNTSATQTPKEALAKARKHLEHVQASWDPVDWDDLSVYGFYCLEAAVMAATLHAERISAKRSHAGKVDAAKELHQKYGLPDVSELLVSLHTAQKATAYGDIDFPDFEDEGDNLAPEDIASEIEQYVEAIAKFVEEGKR